MSHVRIRSGLKALMDGVQAYFVAHEVSATIDFGARALPRQDNQGPGGANRVVFVPFDPNSGDGGRIGQPYLAGERDIMDEFAPELRVAATRGIGEWERTMMVSVWAFDPTAPTSELAHALLVEDLVEWTKRAVDYAGGSNVTWGATKWTVPKERFFGLEVRIGFVFSHPLYDVPDDVGFPDPDIRRVGVDDADP